MNIHQTEKRWTTVIDANANRSASRVRELWKARDLIFLFVRRDFVTFYKQTILGPLWFFIQPLMTTLVFTVIFGRIANIPTDGIPPFLFYMSGIILWTYLSSCIEKTSTIFVEQQAVFSKVYFPRLSVPVSIVISKVFSFGIQFVTFLGFLTYYAATGATIHFHWWAILVVPLLLAYVAILAISIGLTVSALTTKYRDLAFMVTFGVQLWMYATPIVYPMSQAPDRLKLALAFNPMSAPIEIFRFAFLGNGQIFVPAIVAGLVITSALAITGARLFSSAEKTFVDTI
ncbi:ABC transporter permease [Herbaspirillum sp. AP02]|uniref:ABC transporter permease n=1 Tax=unclassified Herbaspirillum TaxID=2624150 RepID=UPI0015DA0749|nr:MULTISPECIES: ABC transporter permease [unclassified Herbaspirillum]MBG7620175.1 ABC transporter permease [Herbaspirillum sp. AP02]NZD67639.1 ABC transporter permease [Herbaspirillum sp. AP21]